MHTIPQTSLPTGAHGFTAVNLDSMTATQVAGTLPGRGPQPRPRLLIDCGTLQCLRTLGVSYVVSELLVLRKAGADVWLHNVGPVLARCLHLLQLSRLFPTAGTGV
ncbi:anti-anti-sigma regulatory factor [Hymenobacter luteus]|uniref:Anti-anti-sigma regulatory factor n=2 Tax=Hymenobacter TaxID=89966 RepID=A0A7W9T3T7_9BACT|nr:MULTISPECIES: hypothetical protein [Hymenobacter]MBB4603115.1 anti-anti-sigma regulatory factor [Hymenobacter latericoloratus]MBB6060926.1 anti-anti-sigma regulatory factor [Hymenobacter luteus]